MGDYDRHSENPSDRLLERLSQSVGSSFRRRRSIRFGVVIVFVAALVALGGFFLRGIAPVAAPGAPTVAVKISPRESFTVIADSLVTAKLLRSRIVFDLAAVLTGMAFHIQSGTYNLSPAMSAITILRDLSRGAPAISVTIPEGANIYDIDRMLSLADVLPRGALIGFTSDGDLEGRLFPDTYQFSLGSSPAAVVGKFLDDFQEKAQPVLDADPAHEATDLIIASLVQDEAPDARDQSIIAGIIRKRLAAGMPLQIDATVCYAKQIALPTEIVDCSNLSRADFTASSSYSSSYNTYLHTGLPPGPIDDPGVAAITAALHPISSSYWYYLSDPATGKIVYAATLAEQEANIKRYLKNQ
jgi:UPF0755 protein